MSPVLQISQRSSYHISMEVYLLTRVAKQKITYLYVFEFCFLILLPLYFFKISQNVCKCSLSMNFHRTFPYVALGAGEGVMKPWFRTFKHVSFLFLLKSNFWIPEQGLAELWLWPPFLKLMWNVHLLYTNMSVSSTARLLCSCKKIIKVWTVLFSVYEHTTELMCLPSLGYKWQ